MTEVDFELVIRGRDELFDKKKTFPGIEPLKNDSVLSFSQNLFKQDRWEIPELSKWKRELNATRNLLNEKDIKVWKQHTSKTNMTGRIVWSLRGKNKIEMCTNAWIKMAEIFSKYPMLIPPSKFLAVEIHCSEYVLSYYENQYCLCEAGSFPLNLFMRSLLQKSEKLSGTFWNS